MVLLLWQFWWVFRVFDEVSAVFGWAWDSKRQVGRGDLCRWPWIIYFYLSSLCLLLHTGRFWVVVGVLKSASGS